MIRAIGGWNQRKIKGQFTQGQKRILNNFPYDFRSPGDITFPSYVKLNKLFEKPDRSIIPKQTGRFFSQYDDEEKRRKFY